MKKLLLTGIALSTLFSAMADEGMWLPSLIGKMKIKQMQQQGLKLTAEDLYSVNNSSLKDAIVLFGRGCTGELISDEGLLLTNHHCGYGQIQSHSSVANDYLTNGFWAMNRSEELPNEGLTVSFLVRMDDVTVEALKGVKESMTTDERTELIAKNVKRIKTKATKGNSYSVKVEPLFYGNQYFLYVFEVFEDVRLVGAPPSAIGKFGGDTDNWMWPRHTGDFSLFRIYADKNNRPAKYSPDNVPYKPKKSFAISLAGAKEGDFTFVYGFPARTNEYLLSDEVKYIAQTSNPHKIALRTKRLDIMNDEQAKDVATRIQYAAKNANVANAWKKWKGEAKGVNRLNTVAKKEKLEQQFTQWATDKPQYREVLPQMKTLYSELAPYALARDYYNEAIKAVELFGFAEKVMAKADNLSAFQHEADKFYNDYSATIDSRIAKAMLTAYADNVAEKFQPEEFEVAMTRYGGIDGWVEYMFKNSALTTPARFKELAGKSKEEAKAILTADPVVQAFTAFTNANASKVTEFYGAKTAKITDLYRLYMKGLMEMQPDRQFYPDANSTLRIAYGKVDGYRPLDAVYYEPISTLEGIMEKDNPAIYDYDVPAKLREVYKTKDYGRWDVNGTVPVAFIASNHTTGGNSGSPILNAKGELLGANFDRTWEGTMSDIEFSEKLCRNISVDIRYVLFVIDRIGGAGYLIEEMKIAK